MNDKLTEINDLEYTFSTSENPDEILLGIDRLQLLLDEGKITISQKLDIQIRAFRSLKNLFNGSRDVNSIEHIFINYILPTCLYPNYKDNLPILSRHLDFLREWLDELDYYLAIQVRDKLLERLITYLDSSNTSSACNIIARIGFYQPNIVNKLWEIAENDNEKGDHALSTLTTLGLHGQEKEKVLKELQARTYRRYNNHILFALSRLGDPSSIKVLIDNWLIQTDNYSPHADPALVFTVLREIFDSNDNDIDLQDRTWLEITKIVEKNGRDLYWNFDIGHLTIGCNSSLVIPTIICWHDGQKSEWFDNPDWARYLVQERLSECIKPRQLAGWELVECNDIFSLLQADACQNTQQDQFSTTDELIRKESAWKTLLRAGHENALTWFEEAVANEDGRFMRQKIMGLLACFIYDPLPESAIKWIEERYDHPGDSDGRETAYRMAATKLARSSATESALHHLLNFGYTHKGKVLVSSTDAVSEVTLYLLRTGKTELIDQLITIIINEPDARKRLAAANTLEEISSFSGYLNLLARYVDLLIPIIYDTQRDDMERGVLLYILSRVVEWSVTPQLKDDLANWAKRSDRWVGGGSLQILASHGLLEEYPEIMGKVLNLQLEDNQWHLISDQFQYDWAPYTIGSLYNKNVEAYLPAIVSILKNKDWRITRQVINWLYTTHYGDNRPESPDPIVQALLDRSRQLYSPFYGETDIFQVLCDLAPYALVEYSWQDMTSKWMPESRVALANALKEVNSDQISKCISILENLSTDSLYPVRRAAYRGLARISQSYLYNLCRSWLESSVLELNQRAAEACGWIEDYKTETGRDAFEAIFEDCRTHPEPKVREAAIRTNKERRHRHWSAQYLQNVISVVGKSNLEVLANWRFGDALTKVGDDECILVLKRHNKTTNIPPNVRHWINMIINQLEQNWKKTTQKWPEPWADISGALERGIGKLIVGDQEPIEIEYSIWHQPAAEPLERHSWGGTIIAPFYYFLGRDVAAIELNDGLKRDILLGGFSGNMGTFVGNGPFHVTDKSV